jgi:hypothetical protein
MSTKIARFEKRLEALEDRLAPRQRVFVWRELSETESEARARHLAVRPEDAGRSICFVMWSTGPTSQPPAGCDL